MAEAKGGGSAKADRTSRSGWDPDVLAAAKALELEARDLLKGLMAVQGLSVRALAKQMGCSHPAVWNVLDGGGGSHGLVLGNVARCARALGVRIVLSVEPLE